MTVAHVRRRQPVPMLAVQCDGTNAAALLAALDLSDAAYEQMSGFEFPEGTTEGINVLRRNGSGFVLGVTEWIVRDEMGILRPFTNTDFHDAFETVQLITRKES